MGYVSGQEIANRLERLMEYNFTDSLAFNNTTWRETWSFLPHKCLFSGQWIRPFSKIMKGVRKVDNKYSRYTYKETHWVEPKEFTIQKLKGRL